MNQCSHAVAIPWYQNFAKVGNLPKPTQVTTNTTTTTTTTTTKPLSPKQVGVG